MKKKILVADDEPSVRRVLARAFRSDEYEFLSVSNGKDALDLASGAVPDLILLDLDMPKKSGLDVLKELRLNVQTRLIPVILLTGYGAVSDRVGGLEMGADDYVTKPFVVAELLARVESALRRHQLGVAANPLTRLPGSPSVEEEVNRRIREGSPFAFLYVDINHFKPYNDAYGFARGDQVIRETADVLLESLLAEGGGGGFVGHIGGDDFVVVTEPDRALNVAQKIVMEFDRRATSFYGYADGRRGYVEAVNRQGVPQRFPLISLSIGIVTTERRTLDHYAKVAQIAAEMKSCCKAGPQRRLSRFAFDRRRDF